MRLSKSWIIASKDFKVYIKKRTLLYALVVIPLLIAILLPVIVSFAGHKNGASGIPATELTGTPPCILFLLHHLGWVSSNLHRFLHVGRREGRKEPRATLGNPYDRQ